MSRVIVVCINQFSSTTYFGPTLYVSIATVAPEAVCSFVFLFIIHAALRSGRRNNGSGYYNFDSMDLNSKELTEEENNNAIPMRYRE
jgi:hypothetical protein